MDEACIARRIDHPVQLAYELHLLTERRHAAFETEQGHRNAPAVAGRADQIASCRDGPVEEHFVEFRPAIQLLDGTNLDAGLRERYQKERQPAVATRFRIGACEHEDPVGVVRERSPDLLASHTP